MPIWTRRRQWRDARLQGTVRITLRDILVPPVAGWLARFRMQHDDIDYEVASDNASLDLLQREADIALRFSARPRPI